MSAPSDSQDAPAALLALYDEALPAVYGYFVRRCADRGTAEDLTSDTFLAAMDAARKDSPPPMTVPWLIGVARHKLADHYRRRHDRSPVGAGPPRLQIAVPGRRGILMTHFDNHDPMAVLHGGDLPVQPDPVFAARLRRRLESALSIPDRTEGVLMSGTDMAIAELKESNPAPPRPAALPYLAVANARAAIAWYGAAFGAVEVGDPVVMDDGRIGHAELSIAGGLLYLADEFPEMGLKAPAPQSVSVSLMLHVADTDVALERARERGADVVMEVGEGYGSRRAAIIDPFGHRWMLSGPVAGAGARIQHGDIGYVSVWTADPDRSAMFYGSVLGWELDPAGRRVANTTQPIGIVAVPGPPTLFCCYAVADVEAARQAILAAGGEAGEISLAPHGPTVDATDPFGTEFAVYEPTGADPRPALNGSGPSELSYVTYRVLGDSAAFREFYSRVLHWTYEPGHIDDGWEPMSVHPMAGIAGGQSTTVTVPMWTVENIRDAVDRVRAAGGTVIQEPSQQSYGLMAECTDDQGSPFYLGQF